MQVCNIADDNTTYTRGENLDSVASNIKSDNTRLCIEINGIVVKMVNNVKSR